MPAACNETGTCAWIPKKIRVRYACTKKLLEDNVNADNAAALANGVVTLPQIDEHRDLARITEGKTKRICGVEVKIGEDILKPGWGLSIQECPGVPIKGGFFEQGDCWWFEWQDCEYGFGERSFGKVTFDTDQPRNTTSGDEVIRDLTIDLDGELCPFGYDEACWPRTQLEDCATEDEETTDCPKYVDDCCESLKAEAGEGGEPAATGCCTTTVNGVASTTVTTAAACTGENQKWVAGDCAGKTTTNQTKVGA